MRAEGGPVELFRWRNGDGGREVITMPTPVDSATSPEPIIQWDVTVPRDKDVARFEEILRATHPDLAARTTVRARRRWWWRA